MYIICPLHIISPEYLRSRNVCQIINRTFARERNDKKKESALDSKLSIPFMQKVTVQFEYKVCLVVCECSKDAAEVSDFQPLCASCCTGGFFPSLGT